MKILVITHNFPNEGNRNHGIFAARQLFEMKNQGAEITVITPMVWCPSFLRNFKRWKIYNHKWKCEYKGIRAIVVPYLRLPGKWFRPWASRSIFCAIKDKVVQLHRKDHFDIIYARFLHPEGYATVRLSKIIGVPAVGVGAGDEVNVYPHESWLLNRDFIRILNELDGILASGPRVAANIEKACGRKPLVVHGVVNLNEFSPVETKEPVRKSLGLPLDKLIVLYVGTFKTAKGVYEMIEAFARLQRKFPNVILKICGYGRQEAKMRQMIKTMGASETIEIVGMIDSINVHKWMQAADLFVLASYAEGMPNAVMEAMACGLPIVATAVGGLPGDIGDCEGAILVPPKNVQELDRAMTKVVENEKLRRHMSDSARKRAEEKFDVNRNAKMVLDYLFEITEKFQKDD